MRKAYSVAFKQKMVTRLVGRDATSANRLAQETGVSQEALSRWRREASSLPVVTQDKRRLFSVEQKGEIVAATAKLEGPELVAYLQQAGVKLQELERWRLALGDEAGGSSLAATKQIKKLERELARKEKALAEAAALLILKKKLEDYYSEAEDGNTDEENDK